MAVNQPLHSSLKSAERANSKTENRRESRVRFHGVAIREFARSLGDNPATDDGPPLGLSWEFWDVKRERKGFNDKYPIDMIPIDDYEKAGERRRTPEQKPESIMMMSENFLIIFLTVVNKILNSYSILN